MRKIQFKLLAFLAALFITIAPASLTVLASEFGPIHFNTDEGYEVVIDDQAGYLSQEEIEELSKIMITTAKYGNAVFITTETNVTSTAERYATNYFESRYGTNSGGMVFIIDRSPNNGEIYLISEGRFEKYLTNSRCTSITDNTYRYATAAGGRNYAKCAIKTFEQVNRALVGRPIFTPMKFICAALLAIVIALVINYLRVKSYSKPAKAANGVILNSIDSQININNAKAFQTGSTKTYSPRSSGSSSGSHSSGSGRSGGHSGGGSHHSGGGHRI